MERFDKFVSEETRQAPHHLGAGTVRALIAQYGSAYSELVKYQRPGESGEAALDMVRAEILYGIREEMAQTLADIVFRRTTLALPGKLTDGSLEFCAGLMAQELGWNEERVRRELVEVRASCGAGRIRPAEAA